MQPCSNPDRREAVALAVKTVIAERMDRPIADIHLDSKLEGQLEIDSFAMIEIGVSLEERFGVTMPDMAIATEIDTVRDIVEHITARLPEDWQ